MNGHVLRQAIAHLQIFSHNFANRSKVHLELGVFQDFCLDLLSSNDWYIRFEPRSYYIFDGQPLTFLIVLSMALVFKLVRLLDRFSDKDAHELFGDPELLGDVLMVSIRLLCGRKNGFDLLNTQILAVPFLKFASPNSILNMELFELAFGDPFVVMLGLRQLYAFSSSTRLT